jgi:hypothetical protein
VSTDIDIRARFAVIDAVNMCRTVSTFDAFFRSQ